MRNLATRLSDQDLAAITGGSTPQASMPGLAPTARTLAKAAGSGAAWEVGSRVAGKAWDAAANAIAKANQPAVTVHQHVPGVYYGPSYKGPTTSCLK